jgi:DNA-binding SARP family transcriptional activator
MRLHRSPVAAALEPAPTSTVELLLLGGFRLRDSGRDVEVPQVLQRVLVFLAMNGRPLQRPYVAGTLWSTANEGHAHASLRSSLWRIRTLDPQLVETTPHAVGLRPDVRIDVRERMSDARRLAERTPDELVALANDFEAELLSDWYDDWLMDWRERWRQIRLHALEAIARALVAVGCFGDAIDAGLAAVRAEPLRETPHRLVIQTHLAEGNDEEAARHFRRYSLLIKRELGIEPSPRVARLVSAPRHRSSTL